MSLRCTNMAGTIPLRLVLSALGFGDSTAQPPIDLSALIARSQALELTGRSLSNGLGFEVHPDWCPDDSRVTGGNPADSFPEHLLNVQDSSASIWTMR